MLEYRAMRTKIVPLSVQILMDFTVCLAPCLLSLHPFLPPNSPIGAARKGCEELIELGKWNVLTLSNNILKPHQLQT